MKRDLEFINTVKEGSEETHSQVNISFHFDHFLAVIWENWCCSFLFIFMVDMNIIMTLILGRQLTYQLMYV
jgi:hypothetical protein